MTASTHGLQGTESEANSQLEFLEREYVRRWELVHTYTRSSFDDFKLLASIGALLVWPPIAESNVFDAKPSDPTLLVGFVAILFIIGILGVRDFLKQSIIDFGLDQLANVEAEIRDSLGRPDTRAFSFVASWDAWGEKRLRRLQGYLYALFAILLLGFPNALLAWRGSWGQVAVYTVLALFVVGVVHKAGQILDSDSERNGATAIAQPRRGR